jgi:predicted HTH transcriptional regulator
LPEPEFKIRDGFVSIIYRKENVAFEKIDDEGGQKDYIAITDIQEKDLENYSLSENQLKIMDLIRNNIHITQAELSKHIGINAKNIRIHIAKLKAKGFLERIGPDRGGYWKVVKNKQ